MKNSKNIKRPADAQKSRQLPLYRQISELLHREIMAGHWQAGDRLPVESELASQLQVAVGTLRKALDRLEQDGLLERRQGSGTYVKRADTGNTIYQFFHLEPLEGGGVPSADTLEVSLKRSAHAAKQLGLEDARSYMWSIRRLRYLNKQPVAAEEIWIQRHHAESMQVSDLHESLYVHYRENFDFWISRVEDKIDFTEAPDWVCGTLDVPAASYTGRVERRSWSNRDTLEEFSITWFLADRCRYFARWS